MMMKPVTLTVALVLIGSAAAQNDKVVIKAVDAHGRPMPGVKVYRGNVEANGGLVGTTGKDGKTRPLMLGVLFAIAPDGRMAYAEERAQLRFGSSTDLRLHVVDGQGKPLAGQEITVYPTPTAPPLESYTFLCPFPNMPPAVLPHFRRSTDNQGNVVFPKLPKGLNYRVATDVGTIDPVAFFGAVRPGKVVKVVIAKDREIVGQIVARANGRPLANVTVELTDTGRGHMSGYPGTTILKTKTDDQGRYHFSKLPNCEFKICLSDVAQIFGQDAYVYPLVDGKPDDSQALFKGQRLYSGATGTNVTLKKPTTHCDFKVTTPPTRKTSSKP